MKRKQNETRKEIGRERRKEKDERNDILTVGSIHDRRKVQHRQMKTNLDQTFAFSD